GRRPHDGDHRNRHRRLVADPHRRHRRSCTHGALRVPHHGAGLPRHRVESHLSPRGTAPTRGSPPTLRRGHPPRSRHDRRRGGLGAVGRHRRALCHHHRGNSSHPKCSIGRTGRPHRPHGQHRNGHLAVHRPHGRHHRRCRQLHQSRFAPNQSDRNGSR